MTNINFKVIGLTGPVFEPARCESPKTGDGRSSHVSIWYGGNIGVGGYVSDYGY